MPLIKFSFAYILMQPLRTPRNKGHKLDTLLVSQLLREGAPALGLQQHGSRIV